MSFILRLAVSIFAMLWTISAAGSMAMIAMNTWGLQCPRPIVSLIVQMLLASVLWATAMSIKD